jgi:hypothetical protein
MKFTRQILVGVVVMSPVLGLATGCETNQEIPLAKVTSPPPLPAQDRTKLKAPSGHSPDQLPNY